MKIKEYWKKITEHPLGALYGTLLGIVAFSASIPMFISGMWDAALVDLATASVLIFLMLKRYIPQYGKPVSFVEKCSAWMLLILADILVLMPVHNFAGGLCTALAFSLLICAFILFFSGGYIAAIGAAPAFWCCAFMPYHEEIMLLLSFPLRLSATALSAGILNLLGVKVVYSGTTLILPGVNIAITDACSGINQLDAFILIAFAAVQLLHRKASWKCLHFAFIMPSIILGNGLRIVLTVLLYRGLGERVLENTWHTALGYVQIIFAMLIFLAVGWIFSIADKKNVEAEA